MSSHDAIESWQRCHTWLERNQEELIFKVVSIVAGNPATQKPLKANLLTQLRYVSASLKNGTLKIPLELNRFDLQDLPGEVNPKAMYDRAFSTLLSLLVSEKRDFSVDGVPVGDEGVYALRKLVERLSEAYEGNFVF
jgi:hypothetical protein